VKNLTGAGIGAKGVDKRNFEAGILTDDPSILDAVKEQFDKVWRGAHCKSCLRRDVCPAQHLGRFAGRNWIKWKSRRREVP